MRHEKKSIDTSEQVEKLCDRGLNIEDKKLASQYLYNISYHRLRACTYPFQNNGEGASHEFLRKDTSSQDMIDLHCFDRRLCSLVFNAIEKVEAALRTRTALTYSVNKNDVFQFLNRKPYFQYDKLITLTCNEIIDDKPVVGDLMREVKRSNEESIARYYQKYSEPAFPPAWMTLEAVSMGALSKLFFALDKNNPSSKTICKDLKLYNADTLENWMHGSSSLHNACIRHSRVWNRRFIIGLKFPYRTNHPFLSKQEAAAMRDNKSLVYLSAILYLL